MPDHDLEEMEGKLKKVIERVTVETAQEMICGDILRLYLIHPDDPDRVKKYDEWCTEQKRLGVPNACGGMAGPPSDLIDLSRIKSKIAQATWKSQIPPTEMGLLFITGGFIIGDQDVEVVVDGIIEKVHGFKNIPAVVLSAAKTITLSQEPTKIVSDSLFEVP